MNSEIRERLENAGLMLLGLGLLAGIIIAYRGGVDWFGAVAWSRLGVLHWIVIAVVAPVTLVAQYYLLLLLRHSILKHLFWLLPVLWLANNGFLVVQRFIESEYGRAVPDWLPVTDLVGWLLSLLYFPILAGGGIVAAIADSQGFMLTQACHMANVTMETFGMTGGDVVSYMVKYFDVLWDLVSRSFMDNVMAGGHRPFVDVSVDGLLRLPHWFFDLGYGVSCLVA